MTSIDILVIGHLERGADGSVVPSGTWSTSSLVRTDDGHNIVVDTSQGYMGAGIRSSFKQIGRIFPEDVDTVVLTHGHPDHIGNLGLFRNAEVLKFSGGDPMDGVTLLDAEKEIAKGVRFVRTQGIPRTRDLFSWTPTGAMPWSETRFLCRRIWRRRRSPP